MNSGIKERVKVVLDTNILISALGFKGKPNNVLSLILQKQIMGITSLILLAELQEVISKKFPALASDLPKIERKIRKSFIIVQPKISVKATRDEDDNRVLEAAIEGNCDFIITGDKDLLDLSKYKKINIMKVDEFLEIIQ